MNREGTCIKILLAAFILSALIIPAAAFDRSEWVETGDGYMINNICIDVQIGVNTTEINDSHATISVWEWKNDGWTQIKSNRLGMDETMNFSVADGNYTIKVLEFKSTGMGGSAKLDLWTNANVTNSAYIKGGHRNAEGSGTPQLKITKTVNSQNVFVDDIITVTVYIENTGKYDASEVRLNDPVQEKFLRVETLVNNTQFATLKKGDNVTALVYQLKAIEPGSFELTKPSAEAKNNVGTVFSNFTVITTRVNVTELAALVFTNHIDGSVVDYYTQSKLHGNLTIRNTGTKPAQYVHIDFPLPQNAKIDGKEIGGLDDKKTIDVETILPNNEKIISYTVTANAAGNYEITPEYSYNYNGSKKTGTMDKITYRAVGNSTIATLLNVWYLLLIPVVLIIVAAVFILKRYKEYKF